MEAVGPNDPPSIPSHNKHGFLGLLPMKPLAKGFLPPAFRGEDDAAQFLLWIIPPASLPGDDLQPQRALLK
jgi:hypothetical protein